MATKSKTHARVGKVTQCALGQVVELRERLSKQRGELRALEAQLSGLEGEVIVALSGGAKIEAGALSAAVEMVLGSCRPEWKQLYIDHMGSHGVDAKLAEEQARAKFPPENKPKLAIGITSSKK